MENVFACKVNLKGNRKTNEVTYQSTEEMAQSSLEDQNIEKEGEGSYIDTESIQRAFSSEKPC